MKRLLKVILILMAAVVGLLAVAIGAATLYIRGDSARGRIEESLAKALKTPIKVTKIDFAPWGELRLEGVQIPSGDGAPMPLVQSPRFRADYRLWPLLTGNVELHNLVLEQPKMVWAQNAEARWVWPSIAKTPSTSEPKEPSTDKKAKKSTVQVGGLRMVGGTIEMLDAERKPLIVGTEVNANLTDVMGGKIAGMATFGRLVWDTRWVFENVTTRFQYHDGTLILEDLVGTSMGGEVRGRLELETGKEQSPFKTKIELRGVNLNNVAQAAGWSAGDVSGKLSGHVEAAGSTKEIDRLEGPGVFTVEGGRFRRLELFESMAQVLDLPELANLQPRDARVEFNLRDAKAFVDVLTLTTGTLTISAKGVARFDGKLVLDSNLSLSERTYKMLPDFAASNFSKMDNGEYGMEFKVTGKTSAPKTDLAEKILGGKVKDKVEDMISGLFGTKPKEKEKEKDKEKDREKEKKKAEKAAKEAAERAANSDRSQP